LFAVDHIEDAILGYYCHQNGKEWILTAPKGVSSESALKTIDIQPLHQETFVKNLPRILFKEVGFATTKTTSIERIVLSDDQIVLECLQEPVIEGHKRFLVSGSVSGPLMFGGGLTYISFKLDDAFGGKRSLRVYHNGNTEAWLGISYGRHTARLTMIAFDGARLMFTYNLSRTDKNTLVHYLSEPSMLYAVGDLRNEETGIERIGSVQTTEVRLLRQTEKSMLESRSMCVHGILGAEIAYSLCKSKPLLRDLVLQEPSRPGPDLYTKDDENLIQARFLTRTFALSSSSRREVVERHLRHLCRETRKYLTLRVASKSGYCILSYVDERSSIRALIVRVDKRK
jgi:hypothetical protein